MATGAVLVGGGGGGKHNELLVRRAVFSVTKEISTVSNKKKKNSFAN